MNHATLSAVRTMHAEMNADQIPPARITKKSVGAAVVFHGYDGKKYDGVITEVRNRIASIVYRVSGLGQVTARVDARNKGQCSHVEFI